MARPASLAMGGKSKSALNAGDLTIYPVGFVENTTFFIQVPEEVKSSIELLHKAPTENIVPLIDIALKYLQEDVNEFVLDTTVYEKFPSVATTNLLVTSLYLILRTALRTKAKLSVIKKDLLSINVPPAVVSEICQRMSTLRLPLEQTMVSTKRISFAKLQKLRWRIDVCISTGSLSRVMRPQILMQMVTREGAVHTFEVSAEQFNQLRYSVAKVLSDMSGMERHPIIRIVQEFRRREEEDYNH
eukprot:gene25604-30922_t